MLSIDCRLYPNKTQQNGIKRTAGSCLFVYNYFLNRKIEHYKETGKSLTYNATSRELTALTKNVNYNWLSEVSSSALHQKIRDLEDAYKNFFKNKKGFPKFHSKYGDRSFRYQYPTIKGNKINIPNVGYVRVHGLKKRLNLFESYRILSATVTISPDGYCKISVLITDEVEKKPKTLHKTGKEVGIDLGVHTTITFSDGTQIEKPTVLKELYKQRDFYQSKRSKSQKGSHNYFKWLGKQHKISRKINQIEQGFVKNIAYHVVKNYDVIHMEDLDVKGMFVDDNSKSNSENARINRSLARSCMAGIRRWVEYFCKKFGKTFVLVDRYFASSQICSVCGYKNVETKDTKVREWTCPKCHTHHDRDINASINILNFPKYSGLGLNHS